MVNFWPTADMDQYLNLQNRVYARMALADMAATGDGDPLTEEGVQLQLTFRDEQLVKLRDEILDIDDLDDIPTMSDFTLDYFFAQLLRYLERNRDQLERTPYGAYAITEPAAAPEWSLSCATGVAPPRPVSEWPAPSIPSTWCTSETTAGSDSDVRTRSRY